MTHVRFIEEYGRNVYIRGPFPVRSRVVLMTFDRTDESHSGTNHIHNCIVVDMRSHR